MTGLCWFVQIAHYPLFRKINEAEFPEYERKNVLTTAFVSVPIMAIELSTVLILLYHEPNLFWCVNLLLIAIIALSTLVFQAPIHLILMQSTFTELITKVIRTNWIRTISWSIRSIMLFYLLYQLI